MPYLMDDPFYFPRRRRSDPFDPFDHLEPPSTVDRLRDQLARIKREKIRKDQEAAAKRLADDLRREIRRHGRAPVCRVA